MDILLFVVSLLLAAIGPMLAIRYLRPILERVLHGLCDADGGSEFWIRCAYLMAISGTVLLTLTFGLFDNGTAPVDAIRRALWLTLAGVFATVAIILANVSSQVRAWLVKDHQAPAIHAAAARPAARAAARG